MKLRESDRWIKPFFRHFDITRWFKRKMFADRLGDLEQVLFLKLQVFRQRYRNRLVQLGLLPSSRRLAGICIEVYSLIMEDGLCFNGSSPANRPAALSIRRWWTHFFLFDVFIDRSADLGDRQIPMLVSTPLSGNAYAGSKPLKHFTIPDIIIYCNWRYIYIGSWMNDHSFLFRCEINRRHLSMWRVSVQNVIMIW